MTIDVTSKQSRGKMKVLKHKSLERYKLTFPYIHDDHLEVIAPAIEKARQVSGTEYDSTALMTICLHYLACN